MSNWLEAGAIAGRFRRWLLPLGRSCRDALDDESLGEDVDDDQRREDEERRRHDDAPVGRAFGVVEIGESDRKRSHPVVVGHDQRPEVAVPLGHHRDQGKRDQDRFGHWQRDIPKHPQMTGAIDPGRIEHLARQAEEALAEHECAERDRCPGMTIP